MSPRLDSFSGRSAGLTAQPGLSLCDFGHQGLQYDREFGLYNNRGRMYNPSLARFMQRDPLGYVDGMSLYQYVRSSPGQFRDPAGLEITVSGAVNMAFEILKKTGENKDKSWQTQAINTPVNSFAIYGFGTPITTTAPTTTSATVPTTTSAPVMQTLTAAIQASWVSKDGWTGVWGVERTFLRMNAKPAGSLSFTTSKAEPTATCVRGEISIQISNFHLWTTNPNGQYDEGKFWQIGADGVPVILDHNNNWQFDATWWKPFDNVSVTLKGTLDTCGDQKNLRELDAGSWRFTPKAITARQGKFAAHWTSEKGVFSKKTVHHGRIEAQDISITFGESSLTAKVYCKDQASK